MRARTPDHLLRAARLNVVSSDLRSEKRSATSLYGRSKVNRVRKIERRRRWRQLFKPDKNQELHETLIDR